MATTAMPSIDDPDALLEWLDNEQQRKRRRDFLVVQLGRIAAIACILAAWEIAASTFVDPFWTSKPSAVFDRLVTWTADGTILSNTIVTLRAMIGGLFFGSIVGIIVGFLLGMSPRAAGIFEPLIMGLYAVPRLAFAPLLVLWFGIGLESKVVLVSIMVFFMVFYNTYKGVREQRSTELVDIARVLGGNRREITTSVILPGAAGWIFAGFQMAVPYAMMGAIVGEIVASDKGLGHRLVQSTGQFDLAGGFAMIVVIGAIGMALNVLVTYSNNRFGVKSAGTPGLT